MFDLSKDEYDAGDNLVKGGDSIPMLLSNVSKSLGGVARSQSSIPENMNINIMSTATSECVQVNNKMPSRNSLLTNVDILKSVNADSNKATKICQQDIVDWPSSDVYINYTDKTTNLQSEVLGKFITVEAGVT